MLILKVENAMKEWNGQTIFEQVNLEIREGEHIGLIGANGTGKTTLLQILLDKTDLTSGTISRMLPVSEWGWIEQNVQVDPAISTLEYVQSGSPDFYSLKKQLANDMQMETYQTYLDLGGYEWEARVEACLSQLKLPSDSWSVPFEQLSGGQKTRAQLARVLVQKPKFILLDEPTNHLDEASLDWLEQWIRNYPGSVLTVSHDRQFLDRTVEGIFELTADGTKRYKGGYSEFRQQRELEQRTQQALHKKQQRERQDLLEAIRRYNQWFQQAHRAAGERNPFYKKKANKHMTRFKAKEKAIERLEKERVGAVKQSPQLKAEFAEGAFAARQFARLENVSFAYGSKPIFTNVNLCLGKGDRIAVIGPNGAGKSTLLKVIIGELAPSSGQVRHNPQLQIGYFAQELEKLNPSETILGSLLELPDMTQVQARTILACFLFRGDEVFRTIGELSMGEKCRVAFVKLYFSGANLLVLDEPTNYLDIDTRERLEEALAVYPGALVLVSHDRYLTRRLANRVVHLDGNQVNTYDGSYEEYLASHTQKTGAPELDRVNQIRQLELQLTQLMIKEEPVDATEQHALLAAIQQMKRELERLKGR